MQAVRLIMAAMLVLVAGCGGGDDLSGKPAVPEGYAVYRGEGVSFAHPKGFKAETQTNPNGITQIRLSDPAAAGGGAFVNLTIAPDRGEDIEPLARSVRVAAESIFKGEASDEREVKVEGAIAARRMDIEQPGRDGAPDTKRRDLLVLAPDERFIILAAGAPSATADAIDRDAVISSFRLGRWRMSRSRWPPNPAVAAVDGARRAGRNLGRRLGGARARRGHARDPRCGHGGRRRAAAAVRPHRRRRRRDHVAVRGPGGAAGARAVRPASGAAATRRGRGARRARRASDSPRSRCSSWRARSTGFPCRPRSPSRAGSAG